MLTYKLYLLILDCYFKFKHILKDLFLFPSFTFCDVIFYIFMFIPSLYFVVLLFLCLLIFILAYLSVWSSAPTIYLPFLIEFFLSLDCYFLL